MENKDTFFDRFMKGRYGTDPLYRFLMCVSVLLAALRLILGRGTAGAVLLCLTGAVVGWALFRICSKKIEARRHENRIYKRICSRIARWSSLQARRIRDRAHSYTVCPECRAILRSRRRRGEQTVQCPRCGTDFETYIR